MLVLIPRSSESRLAPWIKADSSKPNKKLMKVIIHLYTPLIDAMALLIEKVLADGETRERLLDHSVLNDFFFEEKLKERRI